MALPIQISLKTHIGLHNMLMTLTRLEISRVPLLQVRVCYVEIKFEISKMYDKDRDFSEPDRDNND